MRQGCRSEGGTLKSDQQYRYILFRAVPLREGRKDRGVLAFVMLNPSTATAIDYGDRDDNDQTIKRCIGFATDWGYGRLLVVNLFAQVATKPEDLAANANDGQDIMGAGNDNVIRVAIAMADKVICAWGNDIAKLEFGKTRVKEVLGLVKSLGKRPYTLGLTARKNPYHPLYRPGDTKPQLWE